MRTSLKQRAAQASLNSSVKLVVRHVQKKFWIFATRLL